MKFYGYVAALVLTAALGPAHAGDVDAGKQLVQANCNHCHGTDVYTRPDRKITSLPALESQVRRCELSLGLTWFDEDIDDATAYLNQEFYKFK